LIFKHSNMAKIGGEYLRALAPIMVAPIMV
jgi:hypothetical protein